jgi:stress-induced-phosphoprotein 1
MIDVLGVLMGIDMQGFSRPEGSDELPEGLSRVDPEPTPSPPPPQPSSSKTPAPPKEDVQMQDVEDDSEDAQAKKAAEDAKKAGSEAYKKRDFTVAAEQFQKAWDLYPKDITFLTNLGGRFYFSFFLTRTSCRSSCVL